MGFVGFLFALAVAILLLLIPLVGVWAANLTTLFGVVIPYGAVLIFFVGLVYRVVKWGRSPVPFRIPTTCGQEKSLPWIKTNCIDNPSNNLMVVVRMALEILTFRSLFRNTALDFREGRATYSSSKWLWVFALAFHYSFLVVLIRHLRFFIGDQLVTAGGYPTLLGLIHYLEKIDGFMEVGFWPFTWLPGAMLSGLVLLGAVSLLFLRRLVIPQVRYISLANDWFPLFLIAHIALTGIIMRYLLKVDVIGVKELALNLVNFNLKAPPEGIGTLFYMHLFNVCVLLAYFPFSKLMHAPGVFLSPTRNLANNSRAVRHINPWNDPNIKPHSYQEYEDDFREFMVEAGLPVEKSLEEAEAESGQSKE
ncbi:MAG: sulfate reduction electron transfer complex DsrMKJOP subunit DsrM [Thermodesulfobacteriota bacterium]